MISAVSALPVQFVPKGRLQPGASKAAPGAQIRTGSDESISTTVRISYVRQSPRSENANASAAAGIAPAPSALTEAADFRKLRRSSMACLLQRTSGSWQTDKG